MIWDKFRISPAATSAPINHKNRNLAYSPRPNKNAPVIDQPGVPVCQRLNQQNVAATPIIAVTAVTKTPCRFQKTKVGSTARSKAAVSQLEHGQLAWRPVDDDCLWREQLQRHAPLLAEGEHHAELLEQELGNTLSKLASLLDVRLQRLALNVLGYEAQEGGSRDDVPDGRDVRVEEGAAQAAWCVCAVHNEGTEGC